MQLNEYQTAAMRTAGQHGNQEATLMYGCLGLAGEAGEVAELVKKHVGHGHELDADKLKKELGDVLWYLTYLCEMNGFALSEVAELNVKKLEARYPTGFSHEASKNRGDK